MRCGLTAASASGTPAPFPAFDWVIDCFMVMDGPSGLAWLKRLRHEQSARRYAVFYRFRFGLTLRGA